MASAIDRLRDLEPLGRERELAVLDGLLDRARAGESAALIVHGAPGAGKTTLLEAAIARATGFAVLRATAIESESDLAYAGLAELLAPVLPLRAGLPPRQRVALETALALSDDGAADRFAVGAAVVSLLGAAAETEPVLCALDDAQWLDAASVDVVRFAARRLGNEGVLVLVGARGETVPALDLAPLPALGLAPLADAEARRLVERTCGGAVDPGVLERILRTAGGIPLTLVEVTAGLTPEELGGHVAPEAPLPPGASAADLMARRLDALPAPARRALLLLAAAGEHGTETFLRALDALGLALADLEPAEEARLVRLVDGGIAFRHPLVASAAYHAASAPERRRAHAAVAAALPEDDRRRPWQLAAAAAGPSEDVAAAMEAAATAARRQGGFLTAARAHRRAAELSPEKNARARRLVAAAQDFQLAGDVDEARRLVDAGAALAGDEAVRAQARATLAYLALRQGGPATARDLLRAEGARQGRAGPGGRTALDAGGVRLHARR